MNGLKTAVLLGFLTALLLVIGRLLGGQTGMIIAFGFAVVMNFSSYWFSDRIALKMSGGREVSESEAPALHAMVMRVAVAAGMPKPRVAIIPADAPNAFATGRNREHALVAVTTGIMRILDERELNAVLAHEVGHVKNRDILIGSVAATIAGAVTMIANMAQWALIFGGRSEDSRGGIFGFIATLILAPIAAAIVQMAISRSREFGADETGAAICGDPEALASALLKLDAWSKRVPLPVNPAASHMFIVKPLTGGAMRNLFSTHPPTEERVARLRRLR
jgi:heat shock protein HtpX